MRPGFIASMLIAGVLLALSAGSAEAYVGPGAGLSAIGSLLSIVAALVFALAGFVWYPLKRLFASRPASDRPANHAPDKADAGAR